MKPSLQCYIARREYGFTTTIHIGGWTEDGKYLVVAMPTELRQFQRSDLESAVEKVPEPMLAMSQEVAEPLLQALMDELWRFGIRPKDIGTPGHLAATQQHLSDMRAIVAKQLDVQLTGEPK